jgi:hypothetical protein
MLCRSGHRCLLRSAASCRGLLDLNGDETHGDHEKREAEKPHQQKFRFSLNEALHGFLFERELKFFD